MSEIKNRVSFPLEKILFGILTFISGIYVILRSYHLSFTHDESVSYQIIKGNDSLLDTANHHMMNTHLMSFFHDLFGMSEFVLRLPNVISFFIYAFATLKIIQFIQSYWIKIFCFLLLCSNPFLIEFFSLARGYGISVAFILLSLYFLIRSLQKNDSERQFIYSTSIALVSSLLSVYASFSAINFHFALLGILTLSYLYRAFKQKNLTRHGHTIFIGLFIINLFFSILFMNRLLFLQELNQLYFGVDNFNSFFNSLLGINLSNPPNFVLSLLKILIAASVIYSFITSIIKKDFKSGFFVTSSLVLIISLGLMIENILFDAKFPFRRTTLIYFPLIILLLSYFFDSLCKLNKVSNVLTTSSILMALLYFSLDFRFDYNFTHSSTWKYDRNTKKFMKIISGFEKGKKIKLTNNWIFEPTINYYIDLYDVNTDKVNRNGIQADADYIIGFEEDLTQGFTIIQQDKETKAILLKKQL